MAPTKVSAEQVLVNSFDSTLTLPASVRTHAADIAGYYASANRRYGESAQDSWLAGWKMLHAAGVPRHMCAGQLRKMIEGALAVLHESDESVPLKFTAGSYKAKAREHGYAAPRMQAYLEGTSAAPARDQRQLKKVLEVEPITPTTKFTSFPGAGSAAPGPATRHHEGGQDAKASDGAGPTTPVPGDEEPGSPHLPRNHSIVSVMQATRRSLRMIERALSEVDELPIYITDEQLADLENTLLYTAQSCADVLNRKSSLTPAVHPLFHSLYRSEASLLSIGAAIARWRADQMEGVARFITSNQAAKFRKGREPSQIPLYQPKSREEAVFMLWYGLPCPNCESWRVKEAQGVYLSPEEAARIGDDSRPLLQCYDCNNLWRGYTVVSCVGPQSCGMLFYREDLVKIKRTGKCPTCKKETHLPDHLTQYIAHPETWWQRKRRHPRDKAKPKQVLP